MLKRRQPSSFMTMAVDAASSPHSGDEMILSSTSHCTRQPRPNDFRAAHFHLGLNQAQRAHKVIHSMYHICCPAEQDALLESSMGMHIACRVSARGVLQFFCFTFHAVKFDFNCWDQISPKKVAEAILSTRWLPARGPAVHPS